jgi:glycosyltransferase 2 family protein
VRRLGVRRLAAWIGLAVSALFVYIAVRNVDFGGFWDSLRRGEYWLLAPALAVLAFAIYLRAVRWRILFVGPSRPPLDAVTSSLLIGYLFNSVLPARAGEAVRIVALNQRAGTSRSEALATVVAERVLDVLVLLALLLASAPLVPEATWLGHAAAVGGVAFVLIAFALVALALRGEPVVRLLMRPFSLLPSVSSERIAQAARNLVQGLAVFRLPRVAVAALALTTVSWLVITLSFWICMRTVGLDAGIDAALLVVIAVNLAMILPSGPAGLGLFEAATVLTLTPYGIDRSEALSYAVVVHVLNVVPLIAVGYVALHRHTRAVRRSRQAGSMSPARMGDPTSGSVRTSI